jgi:outer membrane protein OmpA-like peptidoglycan-associated protein
MTSNQPVSTPGTGPTRLGWFLILLVVVTLGVFGGKRLMKLIPQKEAAQSAVPERGTLSDVTTRTAVAVPELPLPSTVPADVPGTQFTCLHWAWNSQLGWLLANGGITPTKGSLNAKYGVNLKFERQDWADKMQAALVTFAKDYKKGDPNPGGAACVAIMGDGAAQFLRGVNPVLRKLGPEYEAKWVASTGYSRGEDTFMGPNSWKLDPQKARGALVAGVVKDGDWNIVIFWAALNDIPVNPDFGTYNPDAINFYNTPGYLEAAAEYIGNRCEDRPVVKGLKNEPTGEKKNVCVDSVVTWTPGDVNISEKKGGLVKILSTRQNSSQMPSAVIMIGKFAKDNRQTVVNMQRAIVEAGDQIKAYPRALSAAARIAEVVFHEDGWDASKWELYYKGTTTQDRQGISVDLGGSYVNNLADTLELFGLPPYEGNKAAQTYTLFGNYVHKYYPRDVPDFQPASEVIDTSYVAEVSSILGPVRIERSTRYAEAPIHDVVGKRSSYSITFDTGKATFTAQAEASLEELYQQIVQGEYKVLVHGHTDSVGNAESNQTLSEARAFAVKRWLEAKSSTIFTEGRIEVFAHGQTNPVAPNDTEAGRARNRRVEIVLGTVK